MVYMSIKSVFAVSLMVGFGLVGTSQVQASNYTFNIDAPDGSSNAGNILNANTSYNGDSQQFSYSYDITPVSGSDYANSFWLVVSGGDNPKSHASEFPIFYGDLDSGNLYAYVYDGQNGPSSFNSPGEHIQTFNNALSVTDNGGSRNVNFSIDASGINDHMPLAGVADWAGIGFEENIGVWFHPAVADIVASGGQLTTFNTTQTSWYDTAYETATRTNVSEPAAALLIIMAMVFFAAHRRRTVTVENT